MTTEVRTPFGTPSPIELSKDGLYRKQILKFGTIWYTDRNGRRSKITFDEDYGRELVESFKNGAFEQVPIQLADSDNRHNNRPDLTGGEVVAVSLSQDGSGVDGVMRLWGAGHKAVELNNKLGVSARILEDMSTSDGRSFKKAVQHVLLTVDPQVRGMSPWEKVSSVDLSGGAVSRSVDLSTATYERSARMPERDDGEMTTLELSVSQRDRLLELLEEDEGLQALAEQLDALGIDLDGDDDEDDKPEVGADFILDPEDDDEEDEATELSGRAVQALELANARATTMESRVVELTNQLHQQRLDSELDHYRREGLAPAVLEAAAPLLSVESGALELSNSGGDRIDPGETIREVLSTVIELAASGHLIVGDGDETGTYQAEDPAASRRDAMLKNWSDEYGN